jgi:hypothetical protein
MPIKKGQSGNPNGRPKFTPNKTTAEIRNIFQLLLEQNLKQMGADLQLLEPKQRLEVLLKLTEFILPKVKEEPTALSLPDKSKFHSFVEEANRVFEEKRRNASLDSATSLYSQNY